MSTFVLTSDDEEVNLPKKNGRPTKYNRELAARLCDRIGSSSLSNEKICIEFGLGYETFFSWLRTNEEFQDMYTCAKQQQSHHLMDQALQIADSEIPEKDVATASMRKLAVETRIKIAEKLAPKIWGKVEKIDVDVNVKHQMSDDKFGKLLETIRAKKIEVAEEQASEELNDEEKSDGYIDYEESK